MMPFNKLYNARRYTKIVSKETLKFLRINREGTLNFYLHVNMVLIKAIKKYYALASVCNYMNKKNRRILMYAFIKSQFTYHLLVCMHHSRVMQNRINIVHEKTLRFVYKDKKKSLFR